MLSPATRRARRACRTSALHELAARRRELADALADEDAIDPIDLVDRAMAAHATAEAVEVLAARRAL
jgi:hypothetical protein